MAAYFVAKVLYGRVAKATLVGVNGQTEIVEAGQTSVEVLCMIRSRLTCHQHITDVHKNEVEITVDKVYEALESLTGIS